MEILITGGTGLIGSHLVDSLLARGDRLTVLTRRPERAAARWPEIRFIDRFDVIDNGQRFDVMVNLAGESIGARPWSAARKRKIRDSRILTTERLTRLIGRLAYKPAALVSASAVGYYGQHPSKDFTEESEPVTGSFSHELCRDWEARAMEATRHGVRVCVLRFGLVLAREGGILPQMMLPVRLGLGARIGDGRQWMPWIHISDLIMLISRALEDERFEGALNAVASNPVTNAEFTRALGRALHRPTLLVVPAFVVKLALGQMGRELLLGGARVLPARLPELGIPLQFEALDDALRDLVQ